MNYNYNTRNIKKTSMLENKPTNALPEQSYDKETLEKTKDIVEIINLLSHDPSPINIASYKAQISSLNFTDQELWTISNKIKEIFSGDKNKELREIIDLPLFDRLNDQRKKTLIKELSNTKVDVHGKSVARPRQKNVRQMLADKVIVPQTDFLAGKAKKVGVSTGYITVDKATGHTFILKHFYKSHDDCLLLATEKRGQAIIDRRDAIHELIGSTMYQLLLYDRTPKEALVTPDESHPNSLYIRSKFFENAISLSEFSGVKDATYIRANNTNLQVLEGFEKVIAACHILGEVDYHAGNLMIQNDRTVTKIDHGRSFMAFHQDFAAMVEATNALFSNLGVNYSNAIKNGNLSFNIKKYSESLNQMIHQIDEKQIEAIINQKFDELKKVGFDPKDLSTVFRFERNNVYHIGPFNDFNDLGIFYKNKLKEHFSNMKEIAKSVDIVSKFSNVSTKFQNGEWLEAFANSPIKDPVAYAAHHNIKIEGKNALDWANENNYQIKVYDGYTEKYTQQQQWEKTANEKWQEKTITAIEIEKDITNLDPREYITITEKRLKLVEDQLISIANNLKKERRQIPKKEIAGLYDRLLDILKNEKYLTEEECDNIRKDKIYDQHIVDTTKLVNITTTNTTPIPFIDKIRYRIANFCKTISLSRLSNYLVKQISSKNLEIISSVETAIRDSTKFKEILLKPRISKEKINNIRKTSLQTTRQR
ncbi:hypothetical protein [Candidatus Tisiphia endosymbiont of Nemotelus uliginosus]|uniref:T4SS effector phosphatidylinositol 3-Kinase RisK1 n=1 Tax=Candidatus Tisiphia endosymbiont of Nemotelus uliginosus TaxID=3077926 RepID=UPI0035C93940